MLFFHISHRQKLTFWACFTFFVLYLRVIIPFYILSYLLQSIHPHLERGNKCMSNFYHQRSYYTTQKSDRFCFWVFFVLQISIYFSVYVTTMHIDIFYSFYFNDYISLCRKVPPICKIECFSLCVKSH